MRQDDLLLHACRFTNGLDNLCVSGAAADVAGNSKTDFVAGWHGIFVEQSLGHHNDSRRAKAALRSAALHEIFLQWMNILGGVLDAFNGGNERITRLKRQH